MAQLTKTKHPVEIKIENGFTFYRPKYKRDWYVSGPDICRIFGVKNPNVRSSQVWKRYEKYLSRNSYMIDIPTKTAKGTNQRCSTFEQKNTQQVRCYNRSGAWFFTSKLNTRSADEMMSKLFDAFDKILRQKETKSLEWQKTREESKISRTTFQDMLKDLADYAIASGCNSYDKRVYILYTKKQYKALFDFSGKKVPDGYKDTLSKRQLLALMLVENDIIDFVYNCMDNSVPYKDIYYMIDPILNNARQVLNFEPKQLKVIEND